MIDATSERFRVPPPASIAEATTEAMERERVNRLVIDIMTKYELFGLTSQLLLAINAFTKMVIAERESAWADGASHAVGDHWNEEDLLEFLTQRDPSYDEEGGDGR